MRDHLRLAMAGILLDRQVLREHIADPNGLRRGGLLVLIIGLLCGLFSAIGSLLTALINPTPAAMAAVISAELSETAWLASQPAVLRTAIDEAAITELLALIVPSPGFAGVTLIVVPLLILATWLIYGSFAFFAARLLGGQGRFAPTLAALAVPNGTRLLDLVAIFPTLFVGGLLGQAGLGIGPIMLLGSSLLGLVGSALALRETHALSARRATIAAVLPPFLLISLVVCGVCGLFATLLNA